MHKPLNVAGVRRRAKGRLPRMVLDYLEGGSFGEETLRRNTLDLEALAFAPRVLNDVAGLSLETRILGDSFSMPLAIDPVGGCGIFYPNGEVHAARAAVAENIPFCLGTLSISTIEDVAEAIKAPFWFQLYLFKDRQVAAALIERAKHAGCSALILSLDVHVRSLRYREERDGLSAPMKIRSSMVWQGMTKPGWLLRMATSRRRTFGNLANEVKEAKTAFGAIDWLENQWDPTLSTKDIDWVRERWPGKLLLKGILHPEDARAAADVGVDGIVVSNHGGRQPGAAVSTVVALPPIVDAVKGRTEILVDSGIRSGLDILKMLALGADSCLCGRAYCYGLAADGERGVREVIAILRRELNDGMGLCGVRSIDQISRELSLLRS